MTVNTINLPRHLEAALNSNHPWLYRNHLPTKPPPLHDGDWLRLEAGASHRYGIYATEGAIAVRLFGKTLPNKDDIQQRVTSALQLREHIPNHSNAYRLINGEGDNLPGIIADRYDRYVIIKCYSSSLEQLLPNIAKAITKHLKLKGVLWRNDQGLDPLWGEPPPPEVTIRENNLRFIANLYQGQKTGLFLDQRNNRQAIRELSHNKTVLNLFSYNGGFSVYALAGGAKHVSSVDISANAIQDAEKNVILNNLSNHQGITANVFEMLNSYQNKQQTFDLIILDPPSMANNKTQRKKALKAYQSLNQQAMACTTTGGLLASSSCTAQISESDFIKMLHNAAQKANVSATIIQQSGHALDHPIPLHFPEGRYLKWIVMRIIKE